MNSGHLRVVALASAASFFSCSGPPTTHEHTGYVMGTVAQLKVVSSSPRRAEKALRRAATELERIEALTTTHSDSSEVSRVRHEPAPVSDEVSELLRLARTIADESRGAFDPTAGPLVELWGFPENPALPESTRVASARERVAWQTLVEKSAAGGGSEWSLAIPGAALDLGGVAKGWGVDRAAEMLEDSFSGCLVNAGGDLAVRGRRADGEGWLIGVQDPRDPSQLFVKLRLEGTRAVATSGDYQRFFEVEGTRYHHILDPRTGWPARGVRSVTVIASSCAIADAWATAAFVLGPEAGLAKLEAAPGVEGVLVGEDGAGELVLHETSGFDAYRAP